jgi:ubiquinone/menaquinone biosynthesis C-methylase UbiE
MILDTDRLRTFNSTSLQIVPHDLRRGIPFGDSTVDAVYHSHLLEHMTREAARALLAEALRVLKPGGVQRIVVPDWEALSRRYLAHVDACDKDPDMRPEHDRYVEAMIEQLVREEPTGTSRQPRIRRWLENAILGDTRRRGELHRWMYDRITLALMLETVGFRDIRCIEYRHSSIPSWDRIDLDRNANGSAYKAESVYVEAIK